MKYNIGPEEEYKIKVFMDMHSEDLVEFYITSVTPLEKPLISEAFARSGLEYFEKARKHLLGSEPLLRRWISSLMNRGVSLESSVN
mgnify:CR=1 FL=1